MVHLKGWKNETVQIVANTLAMILKKKITRWGRSLIIRREEKTVLKVIERQNREQFDSNFSSY